MTTTHQRFGRYAVVSSTAQMPSKCRGTYRRVAVVDTFVPGVEVEAIRDTDRQAVLRTWEGQSVGKTARCAYRVALAEAEETAREWFLRGTTRRA